MNHDNTEQSGKPDSTTPDDGESVDLQSRRAFLISLGKWSQAAVAITLLGSAALVSPEAHAWGWVNRRGPHYGGGWVNRGGGSGWVNRGGGGWINGGGGGWINGGGGGWINGGGGSWINSGGSWVNRRGGGSWINRR